MIGVFGDVTLDITAKTDGPLQWGSDVVGTILLKTVVQPPTSPLG